MRRFNSEASDSPGNPATWGRVSQAAANATIVNRKERAMFTRKSLIGAFAVIVFGASLFVLGPRIPSVKAQESGSQIEGAWAGNAFLPTVPGSGGIPLLMQFDRDGTVTHVDATDAGGVPPFSRTNSPAIGSWARAGGHSYNIKTVYIDYNKSTGVPIALTVTHLVAEVGPNGDFNQLNGSGTFTDVACSPAAAFPGFACADPLTGPPAAPGIPVTFTLKRITAR
jgi:hypothetical protein